MCCFSFLQRAYTEEELNAKLTRRVQKAARRQAKQEELKRLHRAQVVSHNLLVMAGNPIQRHCDPDIPLGMSEEESRARTPSSSTQLSLLLLPLSISQTWEEIVGTCQGSLAARKMTNETITPFYLEMNMVPLTEWKSCSQIISVNAFLDYTGR